MRHAGSLVGLAVGDALGAPLEGSRRSEVWLTQMRPGGRHFRNRGEVTDDTLQAGAVAESLAFCGRFDEDDLIKKLSRGYIQRPEWFGPTSSRFFDLVLSGTPPHRAARIVHTQNHGSRSNGSVMRGFPLGIFFPPSEVISMSIRCSAITHHDPVGGYCSAFLNLMVSEMVRGVPRRTAFRHARSLCIYPEVHAILGSYDQYDPDPSLDCVLCSQAALRCFMDARSFEQAALSAINLGGDADTVGACTGALAGAYWGLKAIPARWRGELEGYEGLVRLAERIWVGRVDNYMR
ncbi:ADP-ribosylglycohydrolase family protein [Methanoregula formicica]|uniref:ADP-ribosylglycohydrolase n=1 Tax=Methanoregula formicica (strain DSM 22288 / NBRC 105244 / SMSP) TaxID=593750 RepID=L0HE32_METFS|nr:ADP-ribosylglycohydrolase family protein [Methanoregula formicica]AGB02046.1 ADP-ribosylglycohydrolase [Methanoregula formicica SMSP]